MKRRFGIRVLFGIGFLTLAATMIAAPAALAQGAGGTTIGPQVIFKGRAIVASNETAGSIVIFDGPVLVAGQVNGSVVAFDGTVTIAGTVRGDVVSVTNRVLVLPGAHVTGDVRSRDHPVISPGARIDGAVGGIDLSRVHDAVRVGRFVWWLGVTVSTLVLGLAILILPRAADAAAGAAARRTGPSVGWGFLLFFGIPITAGILMALLVTFPLGLALLLAFGLILLAGYATSVWLLGRLIVRPPAHRFLAFLAGLGIFRVVALLPVAGGIVWTLATVFGLGVAAVSLWEARQAASMRPVAAGPPGAAGPPVPQAPAAPIPPPPAPIVPGAPPSPDQPASAPPTDPGGQAPPR